MAHSSHIQETPQALEEPSAPLLDYLPNSSSRTSERESKIRPAGDVPVVDQVSDIPESWGQYGSTCGYWCASKETPEGVKVVPLMCGRWTCDMCGRLRARWFKREGRKAVKEHKLEYFWTLTIDHSACTPLESYELVTRAWNRFRTSWVEKHGKLKYVWVVEPTKSGHAHLHVLVNRWMDQPEVSEMWKAATGGSYVVWVEPIEGDRAVNYLTKYLTKFAGIDMQLPGYEPLKGRHKYAKSQSIEFDPFKPKQAGWFTIRRPYEKLRDQCYSYGTVLDDGRGWLPYLLVAKLPPKTPADPRNPVSIIYGYLEMVE